MISSRPALRQIFRVLGGIKRLVLRAMIIALVSAGLNAAQPPVLRSLLDDLVGGAVFWGVFLGLLVVLQATVAGALDYTQNVITQTVICDLRKDLGRSFLGMPLEDLEKHHRGDLISRFNNDSAEVSKAINDGVIGVFGSIVGFLFAFVGMLWIDSLLLLTVLVCVALGFVVTTWMTRGLHDSSTKAQEATGVLTTRVDRMIHAVPLIRAYDAGASELARLFGSIEWLFDQQLLMARLRALIRPVGMICMQLAILGALVFGVFRVSNGALTVGGLVAFFMYLLIMINPAMQVINGIASLRTGAAALARIDEILDIIPEGEQQKILADHATVPVIETSTESVVVFCEVEYSYRGGPKVLGPLSFCVKRGSRTGIVGPSGSGKSTLVSLIERFRLPTAGTILVDGRSQLTYPLVSYREKFSFVDQENLTVGGSLRDNLLIARDAGDHEVVCALETVGLGYLVDRLDGNLGDDAHRLSGGEKQRLAWARLMLSRDRSIVLLDEPASSVDAMSAAILSSSLSALPDSTTVLLITHNLSHVQDFDHIIVLDKGLVVDSGTHEELLQRCVLYRSLAQLQGVALQ